MKTAVAYIRFLGVNYVISLVCFMIYCNSFYHYNKDHNLKIEVIQAHIEINKVYYK